MTEQTISRDELAEWLRATEGKIAMARMALRERERKATHMDRRGRATMTNLLASQRAIIESMETRMAVVRYELGEASLPTTCLRTDGHGMSCELPFGHLGMHEATPGNVRRRWE